ncbi:phospholipase D-like domain-containing protein [uncultured Jannaschia sp.]|uniref:phospholipase D-like domain-containing protein n=1 Tax=uncultured Jannaschia sp. TaxID=293347 RepID=UPI0026149A39|nr:phospholipase D-like domain-containing protein [uncultured Jannaschia sp.]
MLDDRRRQEHTAHWTPAEPDWKLFQDNQAVWNAVLEQCDNARSSIRLEQYIFDPYGIGRRLLDLLAAKARQGVVVRVLADGFGSRGLTDSDSGRALVRSGGHITMFNALRDFVRNPVRRAPRLHRKTLICDESRLMVGGSCYADWMSRWRDTMIRVGGPLPPAIVAEFERVSRLAHDRTPDTHATSVRGAQEGWTYALGGPDLEPQADLRSTLPERIAQARSSVLLTTPYLVPNRKLWQALISGVENGAKVRILMPARSDHRPVDMIGRRFAHALIRRGVEVRQYTAGMIHAKLALVDGAWSSVSSFNLDVLSADLNFESGVFSTSPALYAALREQWDEDWATGAPL